MFFVIFLFSLIIMITFISDNNGSLVVEPCRREVNSQERLSDGRTGIQNIISLNMKQWTVR